MLAIHHFAKTMKSYNMISVCSWFSSFVYFLILVLLFISFLLFLQILLMKFLPPSTGLVLTRLFRLLVTFISPSNALYSYFFTILCFSVLILFFLWFSFCLFLSFLLLLSLSSVLPVS